LRLQTQGVGPSRFALHVRLHVEHVEVGLGLRDDGVTRETALSGFGGPRTSKGRQGMAVPPARCASRGSKAGSLASVARLRRTFPTTSQSPGGRGLSCRLNVQANDCRGPGGAVSTVIRAGGLSTRQHIVSARIRPKSLMIWRPDQSNKMS